MQFIFSTGSNIIVFSNLSKYLNDWREPIPYVVVNIITHHGTKTFNKGDAGLFATTSIEVLINFYEIFRKKKEAGQHDLRIAAIFTFGVSEDDDAAQDFKDLSPGNSPPAPYPPMHHVEVKDI